MDYLEALRGNGWIPDPGDRVEVVAEHQRHCAAFGAAGSGCSCAPILVLRPARIWGGTFGRGIGDVAGFWIDAACAS
jgi:hypothetical protein